MKEFFLLVIVVISTSVKSQIFLGKTQQEIITFNEINSNKLSYEESDEILTTLTFSDSRFPISYVYMFTKDKVCVGYRIWTQDKCVKDLILKDIETKCQKKVGENFWALNADGKNYTWQMKTKGNVYTFINNNNKLSEE